MSCQLLRFIASKFQTLRTPSVSASLTSRAPIFRSPSLQTSASSRTPLLPCTPHPLTPKSWQPHPQRIWTPLFPPHFCCDVAGADPPCFLPGHLLAVRLPEVQAPAQNPSTVFPLSKLIQDSRLLTLSLKALSNMALVCISSLISHESHSLYPDRTCPMLSGLFALFLAILSTRNSFSSIFHLYLSKHAASPFKVWLRCLPLQDAILPPKDVT